MTEPEAAATRSGGRRGARIALLVGAVLLVPAVLVGVFLALPYDAAASVLRPVLALVDDAPDLPSDIDRPAQRSVILAADGSVIAELAGEEDRVVVPLEEIPQAAQQAAIAIEDADFREHDGVDHRALARAAWANLRARAIVQGGSTITQQYIKNSVLSAEQTIDRKTTEMRYAIQLEERLDKDEILERYLNTAYFGEGVYGIATAADFYFSAEPADLSLAESALLAGLIAAPEQLNPVEDPDAARERRDVVLARMAEEGFVSAEERRSAAAEPVDLELSPPPPPDNPFFVEHVKQILFAEEALGRSRDVRERRVFAGGLVVQTTLDPAYQAAAEAAISELLPDPLDDPMTAIVSVQPGTGAVLAMAVGPKDFGACEEPGPCPRTRVNPAVPGLGGSGRQTGSAFKPIVLATALTADIPPGWQEVTDSGEPIEGCPDDDGRWQPTNFDPADGGVKDMDEAVTVSSNVYHAKLMGLLQPEPVVDVARRLGLGAGSLPEVCALGLGAGDAFPIEMAGAFATIANEGERCPTHVVTRIEQRGEALVERDVACEPVLERDTARRLIDLLQGPVEEGTATAAQLDRPVAGKTGTTDDFHDAWFIGFVPQVTTAVWVGHEEPAPLRDVAGVDRVTGGTVPAQLWASAMERALDDVAPAPFPDPPPEEVIVIPDAVGGTLDDLSGPLEAHDLNIDATVTRDYRPEGTIVLQRPDPGTRVARGHLLAVAVSDGRGEPPTVPSVLGRPEAQARRILADAGYAVAVDEQRQPVELAPGEDPADLDPPDGTVIGQAPEPGELLEPGQTVAITVVRYDVERVGPEPEPAPPPGRPAEPPPGDEPGAPADAVVIAEVRASNDPDREHVVLANTAEQPADISGWSILTDTDERLAIGPGSVIPPGGRFGVFTGSGPDRDDRYHNDRERPILGTSGELRLIDDRGRVVFRARY